MDQKKKKKFLVLKMIAFESGSTISLYSEKDIVIGCQCVKKHP